MNANCIAVVDLETTGLSPWRHDRVIEVGIVVMAPDGTVHREYETLVNPNRDIGPSSIHGISCADVLQAPTFADIAGDVLEILAPAGTVAGHNVSFDKNFLVKEFERIGISLPAVPLLCTSRIFGRCSLSVCCAELGVTLEGTPHRAICDARATARLLAVLCADDPSLLDEDRSVAASWPSVPALKTPCFCREHAQKAQDGPPKFLQRLAARIHHNVEAEPPSVLAYMALIDRLLEDRVIDKEEEDILVDAATNWQLAPSQITGAHAQYLRSLAVSAVADGVITDSERRDLCCVAKLLGQGESVLASIVETAATQLAAACSLGPKKSEHELRGQRICFTGQLQSRLDGQIISRELAEELATTAGLVVASSVTKKLDILVVADPNTQSSKAKKAREYGIRILADAVFWKMIGVTTD